MSASGSGECVVSAWESSAEWVCQGHWSSGCNCQSPPLEAPWGRVAMEGKGREGMGLGWNKMRWEKGRAFGPNGTDTSNCNKHKNILWCKARAAQKPVEVIPGAEAIRSILHESIMKIQDPQYCLSQCWRRAKHGAVSGSGRWQCW